MLDRTDPRTDGTEAVVDAVRDRARPLTDDSFDDLVAAVGDATCVLLGEASHGTAEFYRLRARLTKRLLRDHGFDFVAVEGDWTDCYNVNRYVKGAPSDAAGGDPADRDDPFDGAHSVLDEFDRWPTWMWANWEVAAFVRWLREYNDDREASEMAGFYGLDVYSLFESMAAVIEYLEEYDPDAAERARDAYNCFEPYGEDAREYARSTRIVPDSCEGEVVDILIDLQRGRLDADGGPDAEFAAEQNALVAKNAEEYYRAMGAGSGESWNVRDRHMAETLDRLTDHYDGGKAVVWAHNTHVGDARATDMSDSGRLNLGQLVRESHGRDEVAIVGFGTHRGAVVAGDEWDAPMEELPVPDAREGSYGDAFHRARAEDQVLLPEDADAPPLSERRGHRAIGVVYHPSRELGNYVPTALADRYDAFVHVDESSALHPLHAEPRGDEPPETYPWGL